MTLIKTIYHDEVEGARFGKYNLADNSTTMIYRIDDVMIDSGPPNQWQEIKRYVSEKSVSRVLLTHHHEDHSGNGARIAQHFNLPVHVHENGIKPIQDGFPLKLYQKIVWGRPQVFNPKVMPETIKTDDGHTLMPIYTPGHSSDHVCFLEPDKKWLFTGDLFLATRPKLFRADENLATEILSLKTILNFSFQTIFCAHKGIVPNGFDAIREKLDFFIGLVRKVKELYAEGHSAKEITISLFGKKDTISKVTFKHLCSENLINQCLMVDEKIVI